MNSVMPAENPALTLARLLEERLLRPARVSGCPDRIVRWCLSWDEVAGTDESLDGVLVHARAEQVNAGTVAGLRSRQAAALVVSGPAEPPDDALPTAVVSRGVGYRELSRLVAELTLARETHVLRYGLTVHRALAELLYRGAGLPALCHQLSRLSRCPVAILDRQRRPLAVQADASPESDGLIEALVETLPEEPDDGLWKGHSPRLVTVTTAEAPTVCLVAPIMLGGRHDGWVALIEADEHPHPHDIAEHQVVVEQAVTIVGTEMLRMRSVEQARERARGDFVHALLHGRFSNEHDLEARAAHYDFPVRGTFGVVVVGGLAVVNEADPANALFQLARDVTRLPSSQDGQTLATVVGDVLAVIRQVRADDADRALAAYTALLENELSRRVSRQATIAFGRTVTGAGHILDSYREARTTMALRQRLGPQTPRGFQDLRVFAVLAELAASTAGKAFANELLAPLRADRLGNGDLEQSVFTYLSCGGNINAAARELHVHRNTMLYKLERASRALRMDLRQAEHQFAVALAGKLDLLADALAVADRDINPG